MCGEESWNTVITSVNFTHSINQHRSLWFKLKCCSAHLRDVLYLSLPCCFPGDAECHAPSCFRWDARQACGISLGLLLNPASKNDISDAGAQRCGELYSFPEVLVWFGVLELQLVSGWSR